MFLQNTFQKTIQAIKKHKLLFLVIFLSQIVFFILLAIINIKYQLAIMENLQTVITVLDTANYNETLIQMGQPFLENPERIYQSYNTIWTSLKYLLGFSFLAFLIFEGLNWTISLYMLKKQNFLKLYGKFILTALIYLIPMSLIIYLILRTAWESDIKIAVNFSIAIFIAVLYFMAISFSLLHNKTKTIFKTTFKTGIKKIDYIFFTLIVCTVILGFFGALMYTSIAWAFPIMVALIIIAILILMMLRIFYIAAILELT